MRPFSFDLRDSVQRVAHERKLEELRLMEESHLAVVGCVPLCSSIYH